MDLARSLLRDLRLKPDHGLPVRALLRHLAGAQDSQFSTRQAAELGVKYSQIRALHEVGETARLRRSVWRFRSGHGEPDSAITAYLACWPLAVISHASAARFHGFSRVSSQRDHVTVAHGVTCRPKGIEVHHSKALGSQDIVRRRTLRFLGLARTVCDLASPSDPWETLTVLDDAVALGAKPRWIHQRACDLHVGRGGVDVIMKATAPTSAAEFRSWLERFAAHVFRTGGLPPPRWNVPLYDAGGLVGIVDALWERYGVACELQGLRFHTTREQLIRDNHKRNRLAENEYQLRVASWHDLVHEPTDVVATLMRALRSRGAAVDLARIPRRIDVPERPFV